MHANRARRVHYAWTVAGVTCLALLAVGGVRSSFGVFVQPLQHEFGWDRTAISVTAVLSMLLYGALGPLAGRLADRYGPKWILAASVFLAGVGALASSTMSQLWQFHLYYGLITSVGAGGAAMVTAAAMTSRWFAERTRVRHGIGGRRSLGGTTGVSTPGGPPGLMGAMNVVGTTASGWIADRYARRVPLALYYFLRGLSPFFLLAVGNLAELHLFAVVFGLNYISTVPPTSMLTADLFGRHSVGMLFGWIFFAHQIGAGLASYVGGAVYDHTGAYDWAFLSAGVLGLVAAGMVLAIREPEPSAPAAAPARPVAAFGD